MSTSPPSTPARPPDSLRATLAERSRRVVDPALLQRFVDTFLYTAEALLVDEITRVDAEARTLEARLDSMRPLPFARCQRTSARHPGHVSAAELLMATGSLGCLHAYLFHGCRWDEGWAGFGNRIHRADFKRLAVIGPPVELESTETRTRVGERRIVIRYAFRFRQAGELVYLGDQSAMFVKGRSLDALLGGGTEEAD
ncbi:MAG: hypothetical protein R3F35_19115 [Myxococcota bacterium]